MPQAQGQNQCSLCGQQGQGGEEGRARMVGGWETKGGGSLAKPKARLPVVCTKDEGQFQRTQPDHYKSLCPLPQPLQGKHFTATHRGQVTPPRSKDETPPLHSPLTPQPCLLRLPPLNLAPLRFSSNHPSLTSLLTLLQPKNSLIALLIVFFPSTNNSIMIAVMLRCSLR